MADKEKNNEIDVADKKESSVVSDKKKASKESKPGFGRRILKFFKDCKSEISTKIVWYGKKQLIKSTGLVLVCLVVVSTIVSLLDLGLSNLIMWIGSLV